MSLAEQDEEKRALIDKFSSVKYWENIRDAEQHQFSLDVKQAD